MIKKRALMAPSLLSLLQLQTVLLLLQLTTSSVFSLSISSSNKNSLTNVLRNSNHPTSSISQVLSQNHEGQQQQQQQQTQQLTTLPPTLMTTISPISYVDSLAQAKQQQQQNFYQGDLHPIRERSNEHRLKNVDDRDDTVPLATINNHSRNNLPAVRPPQYVDVSTLVGRDRNLTSGSSGNGLQSTVGGGISALSGASGLSAKSRSGLPECATQQVCNAIFVRMNYTQRLCECSSNYNWKCSNNLDPQDGHTIELTRKFDKRTCEPLREVRACKSPTDWTLLALQSERSGKAHYVVVCKCPTWAQLEGPFTHNHPPYANIPGIRVYGMLCSHQTARSSPQTYATYNPALGIYPEFPWPEALSVLNTTNLVSTIDSH